MVISLRIGHGQPLHRRRPAQCHVWAFEIVGPQPTRGELPHLFQAVEQVLVQPFVAHVRLNYSTYPFCYGLLGWIIIASASSER
jgi:hypothetical protein